MLQGGAAFAVGGAEGGKTIADRHTTVRPVDGGYLLNGTKLFCTGHGGARYLNRPGFRRDSDHWDADSSAGVV